MRCVTADVKASGDMITMDEQLTDQAEANAADDTSENAEERYSTGVAKLDGMVHKIDSGVRAISKELHAPAPPEDPARPRVSIGVQPIDNAVYKIDHGVRKISEGLHKAVDSRKKQ